MVVPFEKENSKMDCDKNSRSLLENILLDNIYMCNQSILKSEKIKENLKERPDVGKHQEDILKLLSRMKTNILDFESKCRSIQVEKKTHFKFRKRSVLSLKRSNNDSNSTEETDVELVGSSMHNSSPSKGCSNKKRNETNGVTQVGANTKSISSTETVTNIEHVPDPIMNTINDVAINATNVSNLDPIVIIANDATETKEDSVRTTGADKMDRKLKRQKRSSSICVENAGSITVPSDDDDEESDEDPIPFSRFDAQEPPDEALDLDISENSIKAQETKVAKSEDSVGAGEEQKNDTNLEKENNSLEDKTEMDTVVSSSVEGKDNIDLFANFQSSSQEKEDLLQLLTDKEKQDALNVEKALKDLSDEDSSDSDASDVDSVSADCPMTEESSEYESDMSDEEREVSEKTKSEHATADQDLEIPSQESQDIQQYISTVRECSVPLQRVNEMSDDDYDRLLTLHNVNKRKCSLSPPIRKRKRARKLDTTSESSDSDTFQYDFKEDTADLNDLLPGSPISTSELLDEIICHDVSSSESSQSETDLDSETNLDSETDLEKSQKKKKEKSNTITSEEKPSDECIDNVHETEGETEGTNKLETWRNDPLLRQRLWSDSEKGSDSEPEKGDSILPKTEESEKTNAINYKPKLRSFVIEDDEDPLEGPTVISDSLSDTSSDSDIEFVDEQNIDPSLSQPGRRNIRAVLSDEQLTLETQRAKEEEDERIERLEKRSKTLSSIPSQRDELVLDYDLADGQPLIVVDQGLRDHLKPHQIEGVKFMWEACYESVKMLKTKPGGGCILAHCMGLGKTLQVITLIHTLFRHEKPTGTRHVLIVCPLSTVLNWKNEFRLASDKTYRDVNLKIHSIGNLNLNEKCEKVKSWRSEGGVIIMGYEAYEMLSNEKLADKVSRPVFEDVQNALVNPGPDLVVCDEGHLIKNGKTLRNKALMKINTKRRIILTGTPLQNNLTEYYYMVEFVKPRLLGTLQEYKNRFGDPIMNGQFHNSTPYDIKIMKKRNHVLTKLLKKTIQRVESSVLKSYLPEIMDYTLFVDLTPLQILHYKKYINMMRGEKIISASFFRDFQVTNYIGLHPYTLIRYYDNSKKKRQKERETIEFDEDHQVDNVTNVAPKWWMDCTPDDVSAKVEFGSKLKVVWAILEEALQLGDKVLIFSSSLVELDCLEHFLHMYGIQNTPWKRNVDFYRMDGTVPPQTRAYLCNQFNNQDNKEIKAFLISHKVGGLGLNLIAANRVILLEANHNPSYDLQCVYRIFRFGQTKKCFVYRLISNGTMEEKVYRKCVVKLAVASTVVDKYHVKRHYSSGDLETMYAYDFEQFQNRPVPKVPKDKLLATLLQSHPEIYTYHEHQALLENTPEEELNDEDKKLAWEEYNIEESKKNAPSAADTFVTPLSVVNADNPYTAERNDCMPYNFNLGHLLPKNPNESYRPPRPLPPPYPKAIFQHSKLHNSTSSAPPQMFPINMHKSGNSAAVRLRNTTTYHNNHYNYNAIGSAPQHNAPARVGNRTSVTTTYYPPVIQATAGGHKLPPVIQTTTARHHLPPVIQTTTARHHLPSVIHININPARRHLPPVVNTTPARHQLPLPPTSGHTSNAPLVQAPTAGLQPPQSNRAAQSPSRMLSDQNKEWLQRLAQQYSTRNAPVGSHSPYIRNPYAIPSSNGTTVFDNIESIDLSSNEPGSSNAQRSNVPSNQTNVQLNPAQGEFNYALNRFQ